MRTVLAIVLLAALGWQRSPSAAAAICSAPGPWDPVRESSVIVAGRIIGWQFVDPPHELTSGVAAVTIRVTLRVDRVFKGEASRTITFIDKGSPGLYEAAKAAYPQYNFAFGSGSCALINSDPTNQYVVLGFFGGSGSELQSINGLSFYWGTTAGGEGWDEAMAKLAPLGPARLPRTGTGLTSVDSPVNGAMVATAATLLGLVLLPMIRGFRGRASRVIGRTGAD